MTTIREATQADQNDLSALITDLGQEGLDQLGVTIDPTPMLPEQASALLHYLHSLGITLLLARTGDAPSGFLLLTPPEESASLRCRAVTMAVARDHRRRGIGSALLAAAQQLVREQQLDGLLLTVRKVNQPAIALYRKLGFQTTGETATSLKLTWRSPLAP